MSAPKPPADAQCWCIACRPQTLEDMRFVVCPDCGNKRCPRANDHRHACTNSNEPGQPGSAYPAAEAQAQGDPGEFGVGIQPNPKARYWQERAEFWKAQAIALGWRERRDSENGDTAPPSAPVGVIGDAIRHLSKWLDANDCECESGHQCGRTEVERTRDQLRALAQQPAAVDGALQRLLDRATALAEVLPTSREYAHAERVQQFRVALNSYLAAQPGGDQE